MDGTRRDAAELGGKAKEGFGGGGMRPAKLLLGAKVVPFGECATDDALW